MLELLPFLAIAVIFWLLLIRPAQRQRKQVAELQAALKVGDRIMLASGIFGTITETAEDRVHVEVAEGVVVQVVRAAIGSVVAEDLLSSADEVEADEDEAVENLTIGSDDEPSLPTHTDGTGRNA